MKLKALSRAVSKTLFCVYPSLFNMPLSKPNMLWIRPEARIWRKASFNDKQCLKLFIRQLCCVYHINIYVFKRCISSINALTCSGVLSVSRVGNCFCCWFWGVFPSSLDNFEEVIKHSITERRDQLLSLVNMFIFMFIRGIFICINDLYDI